MPTTPSCAAKLPQDRDAQANGVQNCVRFEAPRFKRVCLQLLLLLLLSPPTHAASLRCLHLLARQSHDVGGGTLLEEASCSTQVNGIAQVRGGACPLLNPPAAALSLSAAT